MPQLGQPLVDAIIAAGVASALETGETGRRLKHIEQLLQQLDTSLKGLGEYGKKLNEPDITQTINVPTLAAGVDGVQLSLLGHRYMMLFCPPAGNAVTFTIPGMGQVALTLNVGWNELAFPDGTRVAMTSAGQTTMLYRVSNVAFGTTVVSVA